MWWQDTLRVILFKGTSLCHWQHFNPDQGVWLAAALSDFTLYVQYVPGVFNVFEAKDPELLAEREKQQGPRTA